MLQIAERKVLRVKAKEKIMSKTVLKTKRGQKNKEMFKNSYRQWTVLPIFIFQYLGNYRKPLTKLLYFLIEQLVCVDCLQSQVKRFYIGCGNTSFRRCLYRLDLRAAQLTRLLYLLSGGNLTAPPASQQLASGGCEIQGRRLQLSGHRCCFLFACLPLYLIFAQHPFK